jgi:hypothetical protein
MNAKTLASYSSRRLFDDLIVLFFVDLLVLLSRSISALIFLTESIRVFRYEHCDSFQAESTNVVMFLGEGRFPAVAPSRPAMAIPSNL